MSTTFEQSPQLASTAGARELESLYNYQIPSHGENLPASKEVADEQERRDASPDARLHAEAEAMLMRQAMDAETRTYTLKFPRLSAKNMLDKMQKFESWKAEKATDFSETAQTKLTNFSQNRENKGKRGLSQKTIDRAGKAVEVATNSGTAAVIGSAAVLSAAFTGGTTLAVAGTLLSGGRVATRASSNVNKLNQGSDEEKGKLEKLETKSEKKSVQALVGLINAAHAPERWAMNSTNKETMSDRETAIRILIGAAAGTFLLRRTSKYLLRPAWHYLENKAEYVGHEVAAGAGYVKDQVVEGLRALDNQLVPSVLAKEGGGSSSAASGSGSTGSPTEHYSRSEAHPDDRMANVEKKFDWEKSTPELRDAHIRETIAHRPDLLASAMETREHGRLGFSEARVNARIREYTVGGKNGEWSAKGLKDLETFRHSWDNGKTAHIMSAKEIRSLQSRYELVNHGTSEGQFKNAIDDQVSIARSLNYHPELGDRLEWKENGDGSVYVMKINIDPEHQDRSCDNWITLRERPPVVATPTAPVHITPESRPLISPPEDNVTRKPHDYVGPKHYDTHQNKETPPADKPPVDKPPVDKPPTDKPPVDKPPVLEPKKPAEDINANDKLPQQTQMGDQAGTIPQGPVTHPTQPGETYTPPVQPQPETGGAAQQAPGAEANTSRPPVTSSPDGPPANDTHIPAGNGAGSTNNGSSGGVI